jgi:hypothetical protein
VYHYLSQVRPEMAAHTENFYIANRASHEAYRQSGVVKTMRCYAVENERVCEFCGPMKGKIIDVSGVFFKNGDVITADNGKTLALDYRAIDVASLHASCRCFIRPMDTIT